MKKVRLKEIFLLTIAGFLDIFQEVKDPFNMFSTYYQNFYGYVPDRWKKDNLYSLVRVLLKKEEIEKNKIKNFKITNKGLNSLKTIYPLLFLKQKKWDKKWRLVIFDIKETDRNSRDILRKHLRNYGFGYLQKSVWISPYDVFDKLKILIDQCKISENVILIESKKISIDNFELGNKIWPIKEINNIYFSIYKKLKLIEKTLTKSVNKKNINKCFKPIYTELLKTVFKDPYLPKELLPKNWYYQKTVELAKKMRRLLYQDN